MIVTCPECDTGFQLDESRVPSKGIRVRCSRCKHAFHLAHPSASQSEAIDAVAAEAVTDGGTSTPSVTQDLGTPSEMAASNGSSSSQKFQGDEINNEDAAEWEFNHDVPPNAQAPPKPEAKPKPKAEPKIEVAAQPTDDAALAASVDDDVPVFAGPTADVESGLDLATDDDLSGLELDTGDDSQDPSDSSTSRIDRTAVSVAGDASGGADFGTVDDFSSLMEDDDPHGSSSPFEDSDVDDSLRAQAAQANSTYSAAGAADELGDPENWDFFDDQSPSDPTPVQSSGGAEIGRIALTSPGAATSMLDSDDAHSIDAADPSAARQALNSAGRIVGWAIVIVSVALGLTSGLWTTAESFVAGQHTTALGPVEAVDMRAQWIDTARAGRLLLVTGGLRNVTPQATKLSGPVEIALLDRLGVPLAVEPTALGVELAERQIRELPVEVLGRMRARAARELQSSLIPAGGQVPFQALIFEPPDGSLRFEARLAEGGRLSLPVPNIEMPDIETGAEQAAAVEVPRDSGEARDMDGFEPDALGAQPPEIVPLKSEQKPSAVGYDNPYGEDPGLGLQDL